jgi:hypothetical protein
MCCTIKFLFQSLVQARRGFVVDRAWRRAFSSLVGMMESMWTTNTKQSGQARTVAVVNVEIALSYEIPRWCTAIYGEATFPNMK